MPKKKLTKKQRQKLKLLEQQKLKEEQLAQQKREEDEKQRLEREEKERIRKLEKQKFKEEEQQRLKIERGNYASYDLEFKKRLNQVIQDYEKKLEWQKYIECSEGYNIQKESDLNLLICFLEEKQVNSYKELEELLDMIQQSQDIIQQIQQQILKIQEEDRKEVQKLTEFQDKIISINKKKIEEICNFVIQNSETIVKEYIQQMKRDNTQGQKLLDLQPEISKEFLRKNLKISFWIIGFENNGIKPKPIEFLNLNFMSDIPKAFFNRSLILVVKQYPSYYINEQAIENGNKDLRSLYLINDIACYKYPDKSRKVGNYEMKKIYDRQEHLQKLSYQYYDNSSNFKVYIHIPESVIILPSDKMEFMYWKDNKNVWSKENTKAIELEYSKELKKYFYSVSLPQMAPVTVLTNKWAEFPYQYFQIRRIGQRTVQLCLETLRNTLSFKITPGYVELFNCQNRQLNDLKEQQFTPQQLLTELAQKNVFLCPVIDENNQTSDLQIKNSELENFVLKEITKACLFYHFQLSIWNQRTKHDSTIIKMRENPEFDSNFHENTEIDWNLIMFKSYKCQVLNILESSEEYSKQLKDNTQSHSNLYYLTKSYPQYFQSNYYNENFSNDEYMIIQTLQDLLKPMHLFMLSY